MPGQGLSAGMSSSSAAPPGTGATLDISVEVFGGPAAKVRGPLQRAGPPRLETARPCGATLRRRSCRIMASHSRRRSPGLAVVVHADGRDRLAKLKILSGKNINRQELSTGKILFTGKVFLIGKNDQRQDFLTGKIFLTGNIFLSR